MRGRESAVKRGLWWVCLLVAPAVLVGVELLHPSHFTEQPGMYQLLSHAEHDRLHFHALAYFGPHWWFALHMIQTPMVGLVAAGLWLMVDPVRDEAPPLAAVCAWAARAAVLAFLVYYTVLDGIGGIGLGRTIVVVQKLVADGTLSAAQHEGIILLLNKMWVDPYVGGMGSLVSRTGSLAVLAASILIAASLRLSGRIDWIGVVLLIAFGWELQTSHASPHGPIAFSILIVASAWIWWRLPRDVPRVAK